MSVGWWTWLKIVKWKHRMAYWASTMSVCTQSNLRLFRRQFRSNAAPKWTDYLLNHIDVVECKRTWKKKMTLWNITITFGAIAFAATTWKQPNDPSKWNEWVDNKEILTIWFSRYLSRKTRDCALPFYVFWRSMKFSS